MGDALYVGGDGSGKKHGLPVVGYAFENSVDVLPKAHVEHFIRFIQNDRFDFVQNDALSSHVVHKPARRCGHYLRFLPQRSKLAVDALPAVDRGDAKAGHGRTGFFQLFDYLDRKLASGAKNQRLEGRIFCIDLFKKRYSERQSLSGPRRRLRHNIESFKHQRYAFALDGSHFGIAHVKNGIFDVFAYVQIVKQFCHSFSFLLFFNGESLYHNFK